jgi:N-acetylmuramoyl-L-alanine amidase
MKQEKVQKVLTWVMSLLLLFSMVLLAKETALYTSTLPSSEKPYTIVIDSGHGGMDPGKIASDGTPEKEINLAIALKLQTYLEAADVTVIMTRTTDDGLYDPNTPNKKVQDMKKRIEIMESSNADLVVSLHQNSYSDSAIHGAQVFYYTNSTLSKSLAETLQNILIQNLDPSNHRQAKANDSYYLLKKTMLPIVIVECGFLSNPDEAALLKSDSYQDQLAWVLHLGILHQLVVLEKH